MAHTDGPIYQPGIVLLLVPLAALHLTFIVEFLRAMIGKPHIFAIFVTHQLCMSNTRRQGCGPHFGPRRLHNCSTQTADNAAPSWRCAQHAENSEAMDDHDIQPWKPCRMLCYLCNRGSNPPIAYCSLPTWAC